MKTKIALCVLLISGFLMAWVPQNDSSAESSKLIALENAWNQAQLHHDSKALNSLVSDAFVYTDYDGTVMNKAQFLADLKDPDYRATLIANEDARVISYPNVAIVSARITPRAPTSASPSSTTGALPIPGCT